MRGNCTLSYVKGNTVMTFSCWSSGYSYGVQMVMEESAGRRQRAVYPHRVVPGQFSVTLLLKADTKVDEDGRLAPGTSQYDRWGVFMAGYYNYALEVGNASADVGNRYNAMMLVQMKGRNWSRYGIPVSGVTYGDHMGSILYTPTLVFETAINPYDAVTNLPYSKWNDYAALSADPDHAKWFYPWSGFAMGDKDENRFDAQQLEDYRLNSSSAISVLSNGTSLLPRGQQADYIPSDTDNSTTSDSDTTTATTEDD